MSISDKLGLNISEAALLLGVSRPTMYTLVNRDDFPKIRIGRRIIIPKKELEDWMMYASTKGAAQNEL